MENKFIDSLERILGTQILIDGKLGFLCEALDGKDISNLQEAINELAKYKAIEQGLGIGLLDLFKGLYAIVYNKDIYVILDEKEVIKAKPGQKNWLWGNPHNLSSNLLAFQSSFKGERWQGTLYAQDYNKTWFLTKEEAEKKLEEMNNGK